MAAGDDVKANLWEEPEDQTAGWKPDPAERAEFRYWDGQRWTEREGRLTEQFPATKDPERSKWSRFWTGESHPEESPLGEEADDESKRTGQSNSARVRGTDSPPGPLYNQTRWTLAVFGTGYVIWAICQILYLGNVSALEDINFNVLIPTDSIAEFQTILDSLATIALIESAALVIMAGAVIYFFFQSYRNIERLGAADLRYAASQTIWTWFVPILNLFRPKQIANDIWRASTSLDRDAPGAWREAPVTRVLTAWWTLWIVGSIISSRLAVVEWRRVETTPELEITSIYAGFVLFILLSVSAALLVHFMIRVGDAQAELSQRVSQSPPEGYVEVPLPEEEA